VFLADEFHQRARTHAVGEWTSASGAGVLRRDGGE
jgi:hypothetical protein